MQLILDDKWSEEYIVDKAISMLYKDMLKKIDFNLLQVQVRNQLVKELKEDISVSIKENLNIDDISKSIEDKAKNYAFQRINEKLNTLKIEL
jgi:hypothetical protein